jgi:competence protein ComEC
LLTRHGIEKLRSTVLIVPHHGSRSSCSEAFLSSVEPDEGIISMGWRNWFGFPHQKVLNRLQGAQCRVWRTDLCGAVQIKTDGRQYQISTCRPECGE